MHGLIIGCGYLGGRVARRWRNAGHRVTALTRSSEKAARLQADGITPVVGNLVDPDSLRQLPTADVMLIAVAHDRRGAEAKRDVILGGLAHLLEAMCGRFGRAVQISSTSVYGQTDGSWVDEDSPCEPVSEAGRVTLAAEQAFHDATASLSAGGGTILRLAGLYGPGRMIARVDQLQNGTPVSGRPDAWLNLIHVDDAAGCVAALAERDVAPSLLLGCDDRPVTRREFYGAVAERVGAPPPRFAPEAATERAQGLNKRCRNARLRREPGLELIYPDYLAGLAGALGEEARIAVQNGPE